MYSTCVGLDMTSTDLDAVLRLVSDRQRRCILRHIRKKPAEAIAIDELVDAVSRATAADGSETLDEERIAVQLSHSHLPKFAEHGVIDYDRDDRTVRYQPDERLESLLDSVPEESSSTQM